MFIFKKQVFWKVGNKTKFILHVIAVICAAMNNTSNTLHANLAQASVSIKSAFSLFSVVGTMDVCWYFCYLCKKVIFP